MLVIYLILILLLSYFIYKNNNTYYRKLEYINPETKEKINVHTLYEEFAPNDKLSFIRIFIGYLIMGIPKFLINIFLAAMQKVQLSRHMKNLKNLTSDPEEWKLVSETISLWTRILLKINGIKIIKTQLPYEEVYKKYLGDDYNFDPNEKYSLLVSNHTGFYDVIINMSLHSCGFMAKDETKNYPFVGQLAKGINCLFVKRENKEDRAKIFTQLEERQKGFYEGTNLSPLMLFPEGTTTNGQYILKFKRGAFYALLPIKPQIILLDKNLNYSVGIGVSSAPFNYFRSLAYFGCNVNLCELPVIKPTEYMWEHYSDLGNEKWEIYAEVTRKIMCEIGGLTPSDKTFRNNKYYENALCKGVYVDENANLISS